MLGHSNYNNRIISIEYSVTFFGDRVSQKKQGESKKTDTFDIQMNNKGVSFF